MSDWYLGTIRIFPDNEIPAGWMLCDGSILKIQEHIALFAVMGNRFGGDGHKTFALPDLCGRTPVHDEFKGDYQRGESGGAETVPLSRETVPSHSHAFNVTKIQGNSTTQQGNYVASPNPVSGEHPIFGAPDTLVELDESALTDFAGGTPHNNMQPFVAMNFCIATAGIFPIRQGQDRRTI